MHPVAGATFTARLDEECDRLWRADGGRDGTPDRWEALIARDRTCFCCGAPPSRCEAHHLVFWNELGTTDIDQMLLVCTPTHQLVHDQGSTLRKVDGTWVLGPPDGVGPPTKRRRER